MELNKRQKLIKENNKQVDLTLTNFKNALGFNTKNKIKKPLEIISSSKETNCKRNIDIYMAQHPVNFKSKKGGFEAVVGYSSTETDDQKLLHLLYKI